MVNNEDDKTSEGYEYELIKEYTTIQLAEKIIDTQKFIDSAYKELAHIAFVAPLGDIRHEMYAFLNDTYVGLEKCTYDMRLLYTNYNSMELALRFIILEKAKDRLVQCPYFKNNHL